MTLKEKLDDLNNMILKGEILESMDKYYHPDCVVIEKNDVVETEVPLVFRLPTGVIHATSCFFR